MAGARRGGGSRCVVAVVQRRCAICAGGRDDVIERRAGRKVGVGGGGEHVNIGTMAETTDSLPIRLPLSASLGAVMFTWVGPWCAAE